MDFFSILPEGLLSEILSRTSPRDVCRSSVITRGFKLVADSNDTWDRFLPSDHEKIISKLPVAFSTKKQLYFRLANSFILLDDGELFGSSDLNEGFKSRTGFTLDKASGKICLTLGARELTIECRSDPVNWTGTYLPQSRFKEVANLQVVPWFDIKGKVEARLLSPKTTYVVFLVFNLGLDLGPRNYRYGLLPAKASVRFYGERGGGDGDGDEDGDEIPNIVSLGIRSFRSDHGQFAQRRMDYWMETELGEFFSGQGDTGEVEVRLMGIERDCWTYDLFVAGIELRPKVDS
ncbi:hypothetical protein Vadar_023600 [Vaccinium darrowii]|uniref:Uncharacterized protein n=1 Tax=Vaccinium darrowii TaxID=229202 RepID=A0ACB7ZME5_9ERIC|nr:hypothetical protein Vadar_023600 [Vaccinium darrowii]